MSSHECVRWLVRPDGIEHTRFSDPESFYLSIRKLRSRDGSRPETYVVSSYDSMGFTRYGKVVYLRHDVNAKWAHHATFSEALALATDLADGVLASVNYRYWRDAELQHFGPPTTTRAATDLRDDEGGVR